ncbi:MAG: hypothetical protein QXU45_09090 [Candidatus Bathyarchaeia archaeon]
MAGAVGVIEQIIRGLSIVGNAITQGIKMLFGYLGVTLPDYAITVATIIFLILLLYKFGNAINKIILIVLIFLLLSSCAGLLTPLFG